MSGKVFDVTAAIGEQLPPVKLRGVTYEIAKFTMRERLRLERAYREFGDRLVEKEKKDETITEVEWAKYQIDGCGLCIADVPDEIASTLTEQEFEGLRNVMERIRGRPVTCDMTEEEDSEKN